jgi:hypothetical protein
MTRDLPHGTILYRGVGSPRESLRGFTWFTNSHAVAQAFALPKRPAPTVLRYKVVGAPKLLHFANYPALITFIQSTCGDLGALLDDEALMAHWVCQNCRADGWILESEYDVVLRADRTVRRLVKPKSDIMLCRPKKWLEKLP